MWSSSTIPTGSTIHFQQMDMCLIMMISLCISDQFVACFVRLRFVFVVMCLSRFSMFLFLALFVPRCRLGRIVFEHVHYERKLLGSHDLILSAEHDALDFQDTLVLKVFFFCKLEFLKRFDAAKLQSSVSAIALSIVCVCVCVRCLLVLCWPRCSHRFALSALAALSFLVVYALHISWLLPLCHGCSCPLASSLCVMCWRSPCPSCERYHFVSSLGLNPPCSSWLGALLLRIAPDVDACCSASWLLSLRCGPISFASTCHSSASLDICQIPLVIASVICFCRLWCFRVSAGIWRLGLSGRSNHFFVFVSFGGQVACAF